MNLDIVYSCWARATDGFGYLPQMDRSRSVWMEGERYHRRDRSIQLEQQDGFDMYFSPLTFAGDRKNGLVVEPISLLFADLDTVHPSNKNPHPSVAWETSPRSYQGVWWLDKPVTAGRFASLNKRLTYYLRADRGGWHASKVLRIPGSVNWKRNGASGRVLWQSAVRHSVDWLDALLPPVDMGEGTLRSAPALVNAEQASEMELQAGLNLYARHMLRTSTVDDRSIHLWKVAREMSRSGVDPEEAFQILWYKPWNKWRSAGDIDRLWQDVMRAYNAEASA